jgi:hypothetical protein
VGLEVKKVFDWYKYTDEKKCKVTTLGLSIMLCYGGRT